MTLEFTRERKQATVHCPGNGLQLHHIHRLSDVHSARHASQGSSHKLCYLLHGKHLQQLVKDSGERIE